MNKTCDHKVLEYLGWGMFKGTEDIPPMPIAYHYKCKACGAELISAELQHEPDFDEVLTDCNQ